MVKPETEKFVRSNRESLREIANVGSTTASRIAEAALSLVPKDKKLGGKNEEERSKNR